MRHIRNTQPTGTRRHLILGFLALFTLVLAIALLTGTHALPNAHTSPQALSGRSATVEGSIIDSWDEGNTPAGENSSSGLVPRARFHREVRLRSEADIETYGYILIEIPQVHAALEGEEPHLQDALIPRINKDCFIPVGSSANAGMLAWIHSLTGTDPQKNKVCLYRYRLPLRPGGTTPPLFTEVSVPDFSEAEALSGALGEQGFLIQREHLDETAADALACNWANVERYK